MKDIKAYKSIIDLLENINDLDVDEWIYVNPKDWALTPNQTVFYYIPEDLINELDDEEIYINDEGLEMPLSVKGLGLSTWMLISNLQFILRKNNKDIEQLIIDVNYYREFDTFRD